MNSVLKKSIALVFASSCLAALPATATAGLGPNQNYDFGTLDGTKSASVDLFSGAFDNVFSFVQGAFPGSAGFVAGFDNVGDMTVSYRFSYGADPAANWTSWVGPTLVSSNAETGAFVYSQTVTGLTQGETYWFELAGNATSASYSVTLAPVPEPENWAMLVSGLALMGFVARRRMPSA